MNEIKKSDKESLKRWIINVLSHNQFLYAMLSVYDDYEYIDKLVNEIIIDSGDYFNAFENLIDIKTIAYDNDDNVFYTDCSIYLFQDVEKIFGKNGSLVFFRYDNLKIMYHSYLRFFDSAEEAKKFIESMMKCEVSRINDEIEKLKNIKKKIIERA